MSRIHVGVALGRTAMHAMQRGNGGRNDQLWSRTLEPLARGAGEWPELADALGELLESVGAASGPEAVLSIALMPDLVSVRPVELPPLRPEETRRLLQRNAGRYFPGATEPQLAAAERMGAKGTVLGAAASARLIEIASRAAGTAGWTLRAIVPAHSAWHQGALAMWPALGRGTAHLVVAGDDRTELLRLNRGKLVDVRRFRGGQTDTGHVLQAILDAAGASAVTGTLVAYIGPDEQRRSVSQRLSARGITLLEAAPRYTFAARSPESAAALFAPGAERLELLPEAVQIRRREDVRRRTGIFAVASVALLLIAAMLELWGERRELRELQGQRAAIREGVRQVSDAREQIDETERRLAALRPLESGGAQWSVVLAEVARHLPRDAHLLAFRGRGDSVTVEGSASRAAGVVTALQRAPGLTDIRATAPIRRDLLADGDGLERFTLGARVLPRPGVTP